MSSESLALSGAKDIFSSGVRDGFVSNSQEEEYYSPENQINNTEYYNEMDFYRIQDGERKQPDYILVFRKNGIIPNMEQAKEAQKQWDGLPIVIVDKDKCLESEKQKVDQMLEEYNSGNKKLAGDICQKIRNNRKTSQAFCIDIDMEKLQNESKIQGKNTQNQEQQVSQEVKQEKQVKIEDLQENYGKVTPKERQQEVSKIKKIRSQIQEIIQEKEGEENERE